MGRNPIFLNKFGYSRRFFSARPAWVLSATILFIHNGPCPAFGLFLGNTLLFVSFLDVIGFAFLFRCIFVSRHSLSPSQIMLDDLWIRRREYARPEIDRVRSKRSGR